MTVTMLLQAAVSPPPDVPGWGARMLDFINTPAPYSPFSEYLLVLFVLWLIARRAERKRHSFDTQAQDVLDAKFSEGELSRETYDKYRQDVALRPKR
jgi:hypothetical protein